MNNESDHDFDKEAPTGQNFGVWMTIGFWVFAMGFGVLGAQHWLAERDAADPPRIIASETGSGPAVVIDGTRYGHYRVQGLVNGHPVDFLVDTGATEVSIPEGIAVKIGLTKGEAGWADTANGVATIYDTDISPGLEGGEALLGMSFLRHFTLVQTSNQLQIQTP